ncbi:hypothetical protein SUDANB51_07480 [Streptomyces sp. enrichment culture]
MGLPVPPGFTVATEACRALLATGAEPDGRSARSPIICGHRSHARTWLQADRNQHRVRPASSAARVGRSQPSESVRTGPSVQSMHQ